MDFALEGHEVMEIVCSMLSVSACLAIKQQLMYYG